MRNKIIIIFCVFMPFLCFSCSSELCLQRRTNKLIKKSHKNADTIYLYSISFNNLNLVWYQKGDFLYGFWVEPHKTKKYKPIEANTIVVNDSIDKYFDISVHKDIQCFWNTLDGESLELHVKRKSSVMWSSIDTQCLFSTKFEPNSFPYKLQYTFSKIFKPKDFDFEKMYSQ